MIFDNVLLYHLYLFKLCDFFILEKKKNIFFERIFNISQELGICQICFADEGSESRGSCVLLVLSRIYKLCFVSKTI